MTIAWIFMIAIILAVGLVLLIFGGFGKKTRTRKQAKVNAITLNKLFVQEKWSEIMTGFNLGGPSHMKTAIIEADKLIDYVLKARGAAGNNMGERLKNSSKYFKNYADFNNLWFAHKLRNNIAHESEHELNSAEAKRAMEYFKMALETLGAL